MSRLLELLRRACTWRDYYTRAKATPFEMKAYIIRSCDVSHVQRETPVDILRHGTRTTGCR